MTKAKKSPEQKVARRLQEATGRPYTECLERAKALLDQLGQGSGQEGGR